MAILFEENTLRILEVKNQDIDNSMQTLRELSMEGLKGIEIQGCELSVENLEQIINFVSNYPLIENLCIIGNEFTDNNDHEASWEIIAARLIEGKPIKHIYLDNSYLQEEDANSIISVLPNNLETLDLSNNGLSEDSRTNLLAFLEISTSLNMLILMNVHFEPAEMRAILYYVKNKNIMHLTINVDSDELARIIIEALPELSQQKIKLSFEQDDSTDYQFSEEILKIFNGLKNYTITSSSYGDGYNLSYTNNVEEVKQLSGDYNSDVDLD